MVTTFIIAAVFMIFLRYAVCSQEPNHFSGESSQKENFENNRKENENNNKTKLYETIDSEVNGVINLLKENGFIDNKNDLKIYDQSEKRKDDYFDDVFEYSTDKRVIVHYTKYISDFSMICVENIKNGEQATLIGISSNLKNNISFNINNRLTHTKLIPILHSKKMFRTDVFLQADVCGWNDKDIPMYEEGYMEWFLCFSQREIEKHIIEENIAKLNIPDYITYRWNIVYNSLHFYVNHEEVEHLTITKEELSKEKILQNVEECKKIYEKKYEKLNSIKHKINYIFQ